MQEKRQFLKKTDLILLTVVLLAAAIWAGFRWYGAGQGDKNIAIITVDGAEYLRLDLAREEDQVIRLQEDIGVPVSFEIREHKIRFIDVDCPDHICENTGFISREGQSAVCMPNRTSVWIAGSEEVKTAG